MGRLKKSMLFRLTIAVSAVMTVAVPCAKSQDKLTWQGRWEPTELLGCYHSYVRLPDGTFACFQNWGTRKAASSNTTKFVVSFSRKPDQWFEWTKPYQLFPCSEINDLFERDNKAKPAHNRLMTRPTVVRTVDGSYIGLGVICRGYMPKDGLRWFCWFEGKSGSIEAMKNYVLKNKPAPKNTAWRYGGKVMGQLGDYMELIQNPNTMVSNSCNPVYNPNGPAAPDHLQPTRNRFVAFPDFIGNDKGKSSFRWTTIIYSADGKEWFFAKNKKGKIVNLTPFHTKRDRRSFPSVFKYSNDSWWMWQADGWYSKQEGKLPPACRSIFLYHSSDGINWKQIRKDVDCSIFVDKKGLYRPLKNMTVWFDKKTNVLHGMLSVWDPKADTWRKYHNTAKLGMKKLDKKRSN